MLGGKEIRRVSGLRCACSLFNRFYSLQPFWNSISIISLQLNSFILCRKINKNVIIISFYHFVDPGDFLTSYLDFSYFSTPLTFYWIFCFDRISLNEVTRKPHKNKRIWLVKCFLSSNKKDNKCLYPLRLFVEFCLR